ncbi:MAG: sugar phosphate nucleotidyltransferase [Kiritimatiellaeota bacterium]|nr:sugar phosphate nucleotidyltransferase [Kiritimatiellota bacterium]
MKPQVKKALLLAAGHGVRLRPLTLERPKPLMPLWGTPLLERALRLLESWGVEEISVNTNWRPEVVSVWLGGRKGSARVRVSHEPKILGTGGALRPLRRFFKDEPFWVMNADIAASLEAEPLVEAFAQGGFASAWLEPGKGPRTVETDGEGRITCWHSQTPGAPGTATFCGLHLLSPRVFDFLPAAAFSSIVEAYKAAMAQGLFVHGVTVPGSYWDDAGTPESYLRIHGDVKRLALEGKRGGELYDPALDRQRADAKTFFCVAEWAEVAENVVGIDSVVYSQAEVSSGSRLTGCVVAGGCVGGALEGLVCVNASDTVGEEGLLSAVEAMGWPPEKTGVMFLGTRGSERSFWQVWHRKRTAIYIHYSLARAENARYAGHARVLAVAGVPVPQVLADLPEMQCLVLENCGNDSLQRRMKHAPQGLRKNKVDIWYRLIIEALVSMHGKGTGEVLRRGVKLEPHFDDALYAWERGLFEEHLLKARYGLEGLPPDVAGELRAVAGRLLGARQVLVHRDLQASNILFRGMYPVFLDFQGMRLGAGAYDLASLLYDPYVILPGSLRRRLAAHYGACFPENTDAVTLLHEGAVQRLVQALGAFGRLAAAGQKEFERYIPQGLSNLLEVATALGLNALAGLTKELTAREKKRQ